MADTGQEKRAPTRARGGVVTFLLTDIEGSTGLWQEHAPVMRKAIERHDQILTEGIRGHGGRVLTERGEGDSFFAVFRRASDAVAAARDIQLALDGEEWPDGLAIRVRMAINAGEAEGDLRGIAASRSGRLRGLAKGGEIVLSQSAHALVRDHPPDGVTLIDLGQQQLRDLREPERVYRVRVDALVRPGAPAPQPRRAVPPRAWLLAAVPAMAVVLAAVLLLRQVLGAEAAPSGARSGARRSPPAAATYSYTIKTLAGSGAPSCAAGQVGALDACLDHPAGIAVGPHGEVYIADSGNNLIRELMPDRSLQDIVGGGSQIEATGQSGTDIELDDPTGLFVDSSGEIYVADTGNNRVLDVDPDAFHHVHLVAGAGRAGHAGDGGPGVDALLDAPTSVVHGVLLPGTDTAGNPLTGYLIADSGNNVVRLMFDSSDDIVAPPAGAAAPNLAAGGSPAQALTPAGNYYLSNPAGDIVYFGPIGCAPTCPPRAYVGSGQKGYSPDGTAALAAQLDLPTGLAVDTAGDLFIADVGNDVVRVVDHNTGKIKTIAGRPGDSGFAGDGAQATSALLNGAAALALDSKGDIFIADTGNNRVRELIPRA